jgi:hypothetical protein
VVDELYAGGDGGATVDHECVDSVYLFMGAVSLGSERGSKNVASCLGVNRYGESFQGIHGNVRVKLMVCFQTLTLLYHLTQPRVDIKRETSASINVLSIASFVSMSSLLLQLHLTRENDPIVPLFVMLGKCWAFIQG